MVDAKENVEDKVIGPMLPSMNNFRVYKEVINLMMFHSHCQDGLGMCLEYDKMGEFGAHNLLLIILRCITKG